jgi:ABC-2 type transport system permease protein
MIVTLAHKELKSLFSSPLTWVVFALLQLSFAYMFLSRLEAFLNVQYQLDQIVYAPGATELVIAPTFGAAAIIMLMVTPLLTMRSFADERAQQTFPLLLSAPISMTEIVLGKFLGLVILLVLIVIVITGTTLSLLAGGMLDLGLVLSNASGLALLCISYAAVGIYLSSFTHQPAIAAMASTGVLLALWLMGLSSADADNILTRTSLVNRFDSFSQGLINSSDVAYLLVFTTTFLLLTIHRFHRERLYA